eukprot:scaffold24551_cov20-Tisochrysis_lutea.AAC.3
MHPIINLRAALGRVRGPQARDPPEQTQMDEVRMYLNTWEGRHWIAPGVFTHRAYVTELACKNTSMPMEASPKSTDMFGNNAQGWLEGEHRALPHIPTACSLPQGNHINLTQPLSPPSNAHLRVASEHAATRSAGCMHEALLPAL